MFKPLRRGVVAVFAALYLLAGALGIASQSEPAHAAVSACPTVQFVGVRGSGEKSDDAGGYGTTVYDVLQQVQHSMPGVAGKPINYFAVPVLDSGVFYLPSYKNSVANGKATLTEFLTDFHSRCQDKPVMLVGYSQGAHVAADVYQTIDPAVRQQIVGLALLGDPRFNPAKNQQSIDFGSYESYLEGVYNNVAKARSFDKSQFTSVHSYCLYGDPVCNFSALNAGLCWPVDLGCPHLQYIATGTTDDAAQWLIKRYADTESIPRLTLITTTLPPAVVNTAYSKKIEISGGIKPFHWRVGGNALKNGFSFSAKTTTLSGTPTRTGIFNFSVSVSDATGASVSQSYPLVVSTTPLDPLTVTTMSLPNGQVGASYSITLEAAGGVPPYVWGADGTILTDGLSMDPKTGTLSGIPLKDGQFSLDAHATDSIGQTIIKVLPITIDPDQTPPPAAGPDNWAQYGYDAGRTRYNSGEQMLSPSNVGQLTEKWSLGEDTMTALTSYVSNGVVYREGSISTSTYPMTAMEARSLSDGSLIWQVILTIQSPGGIWGISNGLIIYTDTENDNVLAARSTTDGHLVWTHPGISGAAGIDGNKIVAGSPPSLLDAATGDTIWTSSSPDQLGNGESNGVTIGDGVIVAPAMEVADQTELLEAIDESDGSVLWKLPSEFSDPTNGAGNSALTIRGSTLFDYSYLRGAIEARNVKTGALLWRAGNFTDSVGAGSPDLASLTTDGQSVWLATRRWTDIKDPTSSINTLHKFTDGKEVWSTDLPDTYKAQTPGGAALANGVYYLTVPPSSAPGTLQVVSLAFDADSGQILWTNVVPGTAVQDPPEVAEGHLLQAGYGLRAFSIK